MRTKFTYGGTIHMDELYIIIHEDILRLLHYVILVHFTKTVMMHTKCEKRSVQNQ